MRFRRRLSVRTGTPVDLTTELGPVTLRSPMIGASGTVGSGYEFVDVTDFGSYGAVVAKSVSPEPWAGREPPRIGSAGVGMLNAIGIQNPGVAAWVAGVVPHLDAVDAPVWGSAVGTDPEGFAIVAARMAEAGIPVIEVNLSCPNLDGHLFALDPNRSAEVIARVRAEVDVPVGAKLSPNSERISDVAAACVDAGADWVVLTNTVLGAAIDVNTRRPVLSSVIGGYSGPPLKPIALRCVIEVRRAHPRIPIVGLGGVRSADDVVEYLLAGASAVGIGTAHFANPRIVSQIAADLPSRIRAAGATSVSELIGGINPW